MRNIQLTKRQEKIIEIVKENEPITSEAIAKQLKLTRATLRPDLSILTMSGILDARPKVGYFYSGKSDINVFRDKIQSIKVEDIKSLPTIIDEETSVYDAIVTLFLDDVGSIFVTSNDCLTGIISRKDMLKSAIGNIDINKVPVAVIMTRMPNVIYLEEKESILEAAIKIIEHEVDSLPIVEKHKDDLGEEQLKVIGKISKTNITKLFVDLGIED
ncbi:helix-turn-helix transcriptional regulator [Clostridium sp. D2Q-11]|uniref:Helix-turn-helix transcriptional regulator n=1 Tax=Anaeromonas frigoriresistens TaxID=2683708 RepID=A0A942UYQ2_9FIRM|nr:helix-turn-helix transcriptional regulator [Anaeromonas frigoriresistens]